MRKLYSVLTAGLLAAALAAPASAGVVTASGGVLGVELGALPSISIAQNPDPINVTVTPGGSFTLPSKLFAATGAGQVVLATQLFTGVSLISSLNLSAFLGTFTGNAGVGTGQGNVAGNSVIGVLGGFINLNIPLNVGGSSSVVMAGAAKLLITVTPTVGWTTGAASITAITTETTTTTPTENGNAVTTNTFMVNTVTNVGSNNLDAAHNGTIKFITPVRVLTNAAGNLPLFGTISLNFSGGVPEPGTLLLLTSAVGGLFWVGRRKMRK